MKQSIAIMMYYMDCGGVENALVELLKNIDSQRYCVDLLMLEKKGAFLSRIPSWVNVREIPSTPFDREYLVNQSIRNLIKCGLADKTRYMKSLYYLIKSIFFRLIGEQAVAYRCVFGKKNYGIYDFAFDFHGYLSLTTYFLSQNIRAKRKCTWVHSEEVARKISSFRKYIVDYDDIFCVSSRCADLTKKSLPYLSNRVKVFKNFIDQDAIIQASKVGPRLPKSENGLCLLTVGRLSYPKGYDIAIQAANILRHKGFQFKWYFCGDGEDRENLENQIHSSNLDEYIILLGFQKNPYGYMRSCNLYIQPSRSEGYAITVLEASLLSCTIISTDIPAARERILKPEDGCIVEMNPQSIANAIIDYSGIKKTEGNYRNVNSNVEGRKLLNLILSTDGAKI